MTYANLQIARREAERFVKLAKKVIEKHESKDSFSVDEPLWGDRKNIASTRRCSLDLTRALAEMRKP